MPKPKQRRHTKLWGLNVLKDVAKGDPRWVIPHHHVLSHPSELKKEHINGTRRILIRTDELGNHYSMFDWPDMPRNDVDFEKHESEQDRLIRVRRQMEKMHEFTNSFNESPEAGKLAKERFKFLLLPTRPKSEIEEFGSVSVYNPIEKPKRIELYTQPFKHINPKLLALHIARTPSYSKSAEKLMSKLLKSGKLNLSPGSETKLQFLRWKGDAPGKLEFYDLGHYKKADKD